MVGAFQEMVFHTVTMNHLVKANEAREEKARERIRAAVQLLAEQGRVTVRQIQLLTGCSFNTLYRHSDLYAGVRFPCNGRPRKTSP